VLFATAITLFLFFPPVMRSGEESAVHLEGVEPSLAVVPFDNLSKDPKQDYISDGMMEAILSHLNKIEGLRLTSRTTMMTYRGTKKTIPEIADEVGVRFVLEGSVQRVGDTIRINAQLIDAQKDNHIWAEYYDRKLSDLLSIQSEVAQQIASKLEVKIKPAAKAIIERIPTRNPEAYDLYLRAAHLRFVFDSLEQYRSFLEKAILLDSQFASPYAELAMYWLAQAERAPANEIIQKAEPLLNKSISLNANEPWARIYLGYLNLWYKWDFFAAERDFNYAAQLEPSNPFAMDCDVKVSMGRFSEAVKLARQKVNAEPNNANWKVVLGFTLYFNGQRPEAMSFLDSASRGEAPSNKMQEHGYYADLGRTYLYLGKDERVVEVLEKGMNNLGYGSARQKATLAVALIHLGQQERATRLLNELRELSIQGPSVSPSFYAAMVYAQLGEADQAFHYLEKSFADHEIEMYWLKVEPPFKPLHKDPRCQAMLDKVGFPN
jgi:TolB-like protein